MSVNLVNLRSQVAKEETGANMAKKVMGRLSDMACSATGACIQAEISFPTPFAKSARAPWRTSAVPTAAGGNST